MTILHLIRSYGKKVPGGAEINIDYLVNFIYKTEGIISIVLGDNGVWIFNKNTKKLEKEKIFSKKLFLLKLIFSKNKFLNNIHVHSNGNVIFLGYLISLFIRARLLIKITRISDDSMISRNSFFSKDLKLVIKRIFLKLICKSNWVFLHCLTESSKKACSPYTKNIIIFPNLTKSRTNKKILKKEKIILITSRMILRKNIDFTLDQIINQNIQDEYKVFVIGDGPELKRLKIKYKPIKNIIFKGLISSKEINRYYLISEIFINLSFSEGMSNALIEAMVNGCKPLVSDIPENRDTALGFAIFYNSGESFKRLIKNVSELSSQQISDFASKRYTQNSQNYIFLKELYKID